MGITFAFFKMDRNVLEFIDVFIIWVNCWFNAIRLSFTIVGLKSGRPDDFLGLSSLVRL